MRFEGRTLGFVRSYCRYVYNRVCRLTRKLVDHRNSSISKHDNTAGDQIETLIHDECHPSLDDKIMFVQRNQCHEVLGVNEIRGSGCEDPYTKLDRETHMVEYTYIQQQSTIQ